MQKKYLTIYEELAKEIEAKKWLAGSKLPSENELTTTYDTSRETIRKALNLLSQNGYIQKIRGKGSIVIDVDKFSFPVSGIVSFKELSQNLGLDSKTIVDSRWFVNRDDSVHSALGTKPTEAVWGVTRVREISGERIILDKDYFIEELVPLLSKETCADSIYNYIENKLVLPIAFAQKEMVVEEPTAEDQRLLDLRGFSNIVVIKSKVYLEDTTLFQYTESRHRPDKFRFVDFARRVRNS